VGEVCIRGDLPRSGVGKVVKNDIRAEVEARLRGRDATAAERTMP